MPISRFINWKMLGKFIIFLALSSVATAAIVFVFAHFFELKPGSARAAMLPAMTIADSVAAKKNLVYRR